MGLLGGGNKKNETTVNTSSTSFTRDIGFTGQAGVDLATNLAVLGRETSADQLAATSNVLDQLITETFDATSRNAIIASNSLDRVIQSQGAGYQQLVGGANDLVRTAGNLIDDTAIIAQGQVASGQDTFKTLINTASDVFDKVVGAARGVASDLTTGSQAFVEGATATVERLGPQTKQNQNIAFAGLAVAAVAVVILVRSKR